MYKQSELELRQKIYSLIEKNPGLHFRKIASILDIAPQLADYHLLYLERSELVTFVKEAGYKRYYVKGEISRDDRKKLSLLRQEIPLKIVLLLLQKKGLTHKEILEYFEIAPSTLSYHIKKLLKSEAILFSITDNEKKYAINDRQGIINILIKYKPQSLVDNFSKVWQGFAWKYTK